MAVSARHRNQKVGTALLTAGEQHARAQGARFLQVKTVAETSPSPEYAQTRRFYLARGFVPLEVFPTLWDPWNPALQLVKTLDAACRAADRRSRRRRRLPLHFQQRSVDLRPARCGRCPDRHRGLREVWIVEGADSHEDEVRPRLGLAEERRSARRTEPPMDLVPAVRDASIIAGLSDHGERFPAEAGIDRSAPGAEILAVPAPAYACHNGRLGALPVDCPTEASSGDYWRRAHV